MSETLPEEMTAIEISSPGGPEVLKPVTMRRPYPEEGELLIKVAGAGVNRPDMLQRQGLYPPPPGAPDTPGLEISGTVAVAGRGVTKFSEGDESAPWSRRRLCRILRRARRQRPQGAERA